MTEFAYDHVHLRSPDPDATRARKIAEYKAAFDNPYAAAARGYVDDVIEPAVTRSVLIKGLAMLRSKRQETGTRKHGNVPL